MLKIDYKFGFTGLFKKMNSTGLIVRKATIFRLHGLLRIPTAWYRSRGHDASPHVYRENREPRGRVEKEKFVKEAEQMEEFFNLDNPMSMKAPQRQEIQRHKQIKFKIIERKYFKPPQETNLLTWDAKEQMRYLHQEYPEEWPVDRLAESFPTSRDGVIKILKSKWQPRSLHEVVRHDRRVRARWLALSQSGGQDEGGPLELRYQKLIETGKLAFAAGNPSLPMPQSRGFLTDGGHSTTLKSLVQLSNIDYPTRRIQNRTPVAVGKFESLVKDYCESKQKQEITEKPNEKFQEYANHRTESQKLLQQVVIETVPMVKSSKIPPENSELLGGSQPRSAVFDRQAEDQMENQSLFDYIQKKEKLFSSQATAILDGEIEIPENDWDPPPNPVTKPKISGRKSLRKRAEHPEENSLQMEMEKLQMEGTGKVSGGNSDQDVDNLESAQKHVKKYSIDSDKAEFLGHIRYEVPSGRHGEQSGEEAYIYTEDGGYQYPFGRTEPQERIQVPHPPRGTSQSRVYQRGKAVYDEDGELLYRIP